MEGVPINTRNREEERWKYKSESEALLYLSFNQTSEAQAKHPIIFN